MLEKAAALGMVVAHRRWQDDNGILPGLENMLEDALHGLIFRGVHQLAEVVPQILGILINRGDEIILIEAVRAVFLSRGQGNMGAVQLQRTVIALNHPFGGYRITDGKLLSEGLHILPYFAIDAAGGILQQQVEVIVAHFGSADVLFNAQEKALYGDTLAVVGYRCEFHCCEFEGGGEAKASRE